MAGPGAVIGLLVGALAIGPGADDRPAAGPALFQPGDHVCLVGNALAERMQHHGWLETYLHRAYPAHELSFRNLGFGGDTLTVRQRTAGFGSPDDHLTRCQADVVLAFFGYNESFAGSAGLATFKRDLEDFIDHTLSQTYNGVGPPRMVLISPMAHEDLGVPDLPDGRAANARLEPYVHAMAEVAETRDVRFIDFFETTRALFAGPHPPLTINGVHLTERGNRRIADVLVRALGAPDVRPLEDDAVLEGLRTAVLDKNHLWFNRYRATDGYNVYGGRSALKYTDDISNFTVLQREMAILDVMTANRDRRLWAIAGGGDLDIDDRNAPPILTVDTNKPGSSDDGRHEYPSGEALIAHMHVADGMRVNLFADEAQFPELVNPVQMAWDPQGRLWVAVWPTYPHWQPHQPMNDKLLILEDTDRDGRADRCSTFAGDLHNPTGFELWMGGVLLAQPPDLMFLEDTDNDGVADRRERWLHGLSSADTHHSANSFVIGPDGALYFQEGTFHQSQVESLYGPVRNHNGAVWRFEPRTFRVERHIPYGFANPHGHVFDRWGQNFVTDGTGNQNYYALPFSGYLPSPQRHGSYFTYFQQRSRPCAGTEILSSPHFPAEHQGNLLIADVIQFKGILQYRFHDDGSGFGASEIAPIVQSAHPTFRPSDLEVGPDGALYFLDWSNPLIGHMQHHLRDPSRDHDHGRVYRVTVEGRPLVPAAPIAGRSTDDVVRRLEHPADRVRYRARIELSGRDRDAVLAATDRWMQQLDLAAPDYPHHLLEGLWVHQQHNGIHRPALEALLQVSDYRARAAATRVLRYMRHQVPDALTWLKRQANDPHPRVRLEAVVAASAFEDADAVVVALESKRHAGDKFIDYALQETLVALEPVWKRAIQDGTLQLAHNPAGEAVLLARVTAAELARLPRSPAVLRTLMTRHGVAAATRREAAGALAQQRGSTPVQEVLNAVREVDHATGHEAHVIRDLGALLDTMMAAGHRPARGDVVDLVRTTRSGPARQFAYAVLMAVDGTPDAAWALARDSTAHLRDVLGAVSMVADPRLRAALAPHIRPLMFSAPTGGPGGRDGKSDLSPGVRVAYYEPNPSDVAIASFEGLKPKASGVVPNMTLAIPQVLRRDGYALKFDGLLHVPADGDYTFSTQSDDGSRLYIDGREVVDNDGLHGMAEKSGTVRLVAGSHPLTVTFFENGGDEGLVVSWSGPNFAKQPLPESVLAVDAAAELRESAVRAMVDVPGLADEKFRDATLLIGAGAAVDAAVALIEALPPSSWPAARIRPLIETIAAHVRALPVEEQTRAAAVAALGLGRRLAEALPSAEAQETLALLEGLGGTIILIRTVPHQMLYDVSAFQVEAGKPVAIILQNNDMMPHNLVVTRPGRLAAVGNAAETLAARAGGVGQQAFVPDTADVLFSTDLLAPGQTVRLTFVAPTALGDYPFVCTFPGHWTRMNGIMTVVERVVGDAVIARTPSVNDDVALRPLIKSWTLADFDEVLAEPVPRSTQRGEEMFTVAGCIKCHTVDGVGAIGGPDLTAVGDKYRGKDLLHHILDPSCDIAEEYEFYIFVLDDDTQVIGRIATDDGATLQVVQHLLTPDDLTVLPKHRLREQIPTRISAMPTGLLVILTRDEILDLLAYLESGSR